MTPADPPASPAPAGNPRNRSAPPPAHRPPAPQHAPAPRSKVRQGRLDHHELAILHQTCANVIMMPTRARTVLVLTCTAAAGFAAVRLPWVMAGSRKNMIDGM